MTGNPLTAAITQRLPLVVLSPHLDDAILSCGALLLHARNHVPVTVTTIFTEGSPPPYTFSARRYLHLTRAHNAEELYAARRAEDQAVLDDMGVAWRHLGLTEGLFRRKSEPTPRGLQRLSAALLPECSHVYPTYRHHLTAGRISRQDSGVLRYIVQAVQSQTAAPEPTLLLAPLAVGGHVDHLLVRTAAELSERSVVYYSDFPYNRHESADTDFIRRHTFVSATWQQGVGAKADLIRQYRTQAPALFPDGQVPPMPELYMCPGNSP